MNRFTTLLATAALAVSAGLAHAQSETPGSYDEAFVNADSSDYYYETFRGGEVGHIQLRGDGRSDIDLWVYDEHNNLVAKSTSRSSLEKVSFTPAWTGRFKIKVENRWKPRGSWYRLTTY